MIKNMKKNLYLLLLLSGSTLHLCAQSSVEEVLKSIEANNKTLQAERQLNEVRKLEAHTGNYLSNPTVELNQLWADRSVGGNVNELAVVQAFDFPSVYAHKNKLADLKSANSDHQFAEIRQQILLTAQQTCIEIIYLRQQKQLLENRLKNAELLTAFYQKRLESGDANQLELNKIQLEKINAAHAARQNAAALQAQLEQLQTLNGGIPLRFTEKEFPPIQALPRFDELEKAYLAADPKLRNLEGETEIARREIRLSKAEALPKFDLGYRRNGGSDEKLHGFRIGVSIPPGENKNTVKRAKAQAVYTVANAEDNTRTLQTGLRELYLQAKALQESVREYAATLSVQRNEELLNKALEAGQISMIEYFVEITILYDSLRNYLDVEKEYRNTLAQLFQYQL